MTALVRNFFTNTGLKGSHINPEKPKLSVAFTAVRNEAGEQVVQFGVSACHPVDHNLFKRKEGLAIAKSRLTLVQSGPHEGLTPSAEMSMGSVTFPASTTLDQLPALIVRVYKQQVRKAKAVKWKADHAKLFNLENAYKKLHTIIDAFHSSPEYLAAQQAVDDASAAYYGEDEVEEAY
jgi:hypothetical protein